jgi:predicted RNA-binding Zn-ribbon protein involved in translation (DUF1610 family)
MAEFNENLYCPECGNRGLAKLAKSHSAQSGKRRYRCRACGHRTTSPLDIEPQILPRTKVKDLKGYKFFVITSAVNDTDIVEPAHEIFKAIAEANGGKYLVIPGVYKNPDLFHQGARASYRWPESILPHICNSNIDLNSSIRIRGKTTIAYTAKNPLSGRANSGDSRSEIYGHPQVEMELVATPKEELPKMLRTTGTISKKNYSHSARGQDAEFHHSVSAVIVELEGSKFWTREIHFDGEGVYDLDRYYTLGSVETGNEVEAIVYGDVHVQALDPKIKSLVHGDIDRLLRPTKRVFHDIHDHHIGSHHAKGDVLFYLQKASEGRLSIRDELQLSVDYLKDFPGAYIIDSNHHRHLDRWFNSFKPSSDPTNAELHFELGSMAVQAIAEGRTPNLFQLYLEKYCPVELNFVDPNKIFSVAGIDCSQHGDRGASGARGNIKSFARSGYKMMVADSHKPGIHKGCYQVGVMSLSLGYAVGLGAWMNTHGVIYKNGKRALVHIVNGKLSPSMRPGYWEKIAGKAA